MADSRNVDLLDYLAGNLDEAGRRRADELLRNSPELRAELSDWRDLAAVVLEDVAERPVADLPEPTALMTAVEHAGLESEGPGSNRPRISRSAMTVLLLVAGLALLALLPQLGTPGAIEAGDTERAVSGDLAMGEAMVTAPGTSATAVLRATAPDLRRDGGADLGADEDRRLNEGQDGRSSKLGEGAPMAAGGGPAPVSPRPARPIDPAGAAVSATQSPPTLSATAGVEPVEQPASGGASVAQPSPDGREERPSEPPSATAAPHPTAMPPTPTMEPSPPPPSPTPSGAHVAILVLNPEGPPVPEARVLAHSPDGATAWDLQPDPSAIGRFVGELPAGAWRIYAESPDGRLAGRWLGGAVTPGEGETWLSTAGGSLTHEIVLGAPARAAIVSGRATGPSGSPLERALIIAVAEAGQDGTVAAVTLGPEAGEAAGRFTLRLPAGRWRLGVSRDLSGETAPEWWRLGGPAGVVDLAEGDELYSVDLQIGRRPPPAAWAPIVSPEPPPPNDR